MHLHPFKFKIARWCQIIFCHDPHTHTHMHRQTTPISPRTEANPEFRAALVRWGRQLSPSQNHIYVFNMEHLADQPPICKEITSKMLEEIDAQWRRAIDGMRPGQTMICLSSAKLGKLKWAVTASTLAYPAPFKTIVAPSGDRTKTYSFYEFQDSRRSNSPDCVVAVDGIPVYSEAMMRTLPREVHDFLASWRSTH